MARKQNMELTTERQRLLDVLKAWKKEKGYVPSTRELAAADGTAQSAAEQKLQALVRIGVLVRLGNGRYDLPDRTHEIRAVIQEARVKAVAHALTNMEKDLIETLQKIEDLLI